jgi:hypothetical protein
MSLDLERIRADLLAAQGELQEAHAAFLTQDTRRAVIRLEIALAVLTDVRRRLPSVAAAGYQQEARR